jgi:hypothetical protein
MKKILFPVLLIIVMSPITAQQPVARYDESKVPAFTLPDPLIFNDGSKVINKNQWDKRRAEILQIFKNEIYGTSPDWHGKIQATEISRNENALDGLAVRKEIKLAIINGNKEVDMLMLLYLPHSVKPVPLFMGYNFGGNHSVTSEPDIAIATSWMRPNEGNGIIDHKATEAGRGKAASSWQIKEIVSRGYGLATIYYGDVDPDYDDGFKNGVHSLYDQPRNGSSWGSIAAWAWGLSRALDYLETVPAVDAKKVIVMGHSRLGKTALWAGATDKRFAIVISNESGYGGAAISRRLFGETVGNMNREFPHWFCENFKKYNENEKNLPIDQHELIALIAPRPVYVASAEQDLWSDPRGEFLSCVAASPVYMLLGKDGFAAKEMPAVNTPITGSIGYHIRTGVHDVTVYDWQRYLDFADYHLKGK